MYSTLIIQLKPWSALPALRLLPRDRLILDCPLSQILVITSTDGIYSQSQGGGAQLSASAFCG